MPSSGNDIAVDPSHIQADNESDGSDDSSSSDVEDATVMKKLRHTKVSADVIAESMRRSGRMMAR